MWPTRVKRKNPVIDTSRVRKTYSRSSDATLTKAPMGAQVAPAPAESSPERGAGSRTAGSGSGAAPGGSGAGSGAGAGAASVGGGAADGGDLAGLIQARILAHRRYPLLARKRGLE